MTLVDSCLDVATILNLSYAHRESFSWNQKSGNQEIKIDKGGKGEGGNLLAKFAEVMWA